jgi:hypothetical protein
MVNRVVKLFTGVDVDDLKKSNQELKSEIVSKQLLLDVLWASASRVAKSNSRNPAQEWRDLRNILDDIKNRQN